MLVLPWQPARIHLLQNVTHGKDEQAVVGAGGVPQKMIVPPGRMSAEPMQERLVNGAVDPSDEVMP
jgi:hypothetical protein